MTSEVFWPKSSWRFLRSCSCPQTRRRIHTVPVQTPTTPKHNQRKLNSFRIQQLRKVLRFLSPKTSRKQRFDGDPFVKNPNDSKLWDVNLNLAPYIHPLTNKLRDNRVLQAPSILALLKVFCKEKKKDPGKHLQCHFNHYISSQGNVCYKCLMCPKIHEMLPFYNPVACDTVQFNLHITVGCFEIICFCFFLL